MGAEVNIRTGYDAAGYGRRLAGWTTTRKDQNTVLASDLASLRARAFDAWRNYAYHYAAIEDLVSTEIGTGISPMFSSSDEEFNNLARELWPQWADECDADGCLGWGGLLEQARRTRGVQGEMFIRFRSRRSEDGLTIPLQLQALGPEMCPHDFNRALKNGHAIREGIEYNAIGQRIFYWFYRRHPDDPFFSHGVGPDQMVRVPADQVIHYFRPAFPGQRRAEPSAASGMLEGRIYQEYRDAELDRKKDKAHFTGVIERPGYSEESYNFNPMDGTPLPKPNTTAGHNFNMEPGTFTALYDGEKLNLFDGDSAGAGFEAFQRDRMLSQAAAHGVPFEHISGDYSKVNDRLLRGILLRYFRHTDMEREHYTVKQLCKPVGRAFVRGLVMAGHLSPSDYQENQRNYEKITWRPHAHKHLHPLQQAQTEELMMLMNTLSRARIFAERGEDLGEINQEIESDPLHPTNKASVTTQKTAVESSNDKKEDSDDV